jgi:hypothetical protein
VVHIFKEVEQLRNRRLPRFLEDVLCKLEVPFSFEMVDAKLKSDAISGGGATLDKGIMPPIFSLCPKLVGSEGGACTNL